MSTTAFDMNNSLEKTLAAMLVSGRFPHAVILEGGTATERLSLAKKIAAALVCSEIKAEAPCGSCSHCKKAFADSHPDIPFFTAEDKPRAFKVDFVREIRNNAYIIPNEADKKVFILENAHTMGNEGQNAILKILEEPPTYVNFIMLCSSKSGFLPTVLSRATVFTIGEAKNDDDAENRAASVEAAMAIARAAASVDDYEIVKAAAVFEKDAKLLKNTIPVIQEIFAAALREKFGAAENSEEFGALPEELARKLSRRALPDLIEGCDKLMASLRMNANHNLMLTSLCTTLRKAVSK